ncbi:MAG: flagellar basal body-associated FliL family protein [Desulfobacteraceae bacterium]|nr:MAG: flagellar basal body-associated FliL family protein [Desulfobacteraceae bacterium]
MLNKLLIIMMGVLVLLMVAIGGGLFMMWSKVSALDQVVNPPSEEESQEESEVVEQKAGIGPLFPLDTFIANLADPGGNRFLRTTMELEFADESVREEMEKRLPQIRDCILMILPTKKYQDFQSAEGKIALRTEIISKLNDLLKNKTIINLYFTEFVTQ